MSKYYNSTSTKYHSNVAGSTSIRNHPTTFKLVDGAIITITEDDRLIASIGMYEAGENSKYIPVGHGIEFKILNTWEDDASTSGSQMRWKLPKGTQVLE